jgi:RNA polymerase sigma factor (sigma-70 family)
MSRHHARSDDELLVLARSDADAFAELYDRHAGALADWLARRSPPDAAQELFAETFAQAWCSRRRYRPAKGPARAWLFGIARHLLHDSYRRLAVEDRARRRLGVLDETAPAADTDARLDAAALRAELESGLAELARKLRAAVVLRVVEQLDYDELAARLGCSSQAARLRVSRGLRALRRTAEPSCQRAGVSAITEGVTP